MPWKCPCHHLLVAEPDAARGVRREIPEGSEEWDLLLRRYYSEELKKLGIDLGK